MRILLVEDDPTLADGLSRSFIDWGFDDTLAMTGAYADTVLRTQPYDLLILDLGLPDTDGLELLRQLRARKSAIPVLILTARDGLNDRIKSLELGADDYMAKPLELQELAARVRALLRRSHGVFNHEIAVGRLAFDMFKQQIKVDGVPILLPSWEFGVLEALLLQMGRVVSRDSIAQRLAVHADELADNAIEVYIHRLRKRLAPYRHRHQSSERARLSAGTTQRWLNLEA